MRDDPFVVAMSGVPVWKVRVATYVLASLLAGLGGAIFSQIDGYLASFDFNTTFTILLFAAVLVGGPRTLMGPTIGIILLYIVPREVIKVEGYSDLIYGATVLIVVVFLRDGLEQGVRDVVAHLRRRREDAAADAPGVGVSGLDPDRLAADLWQLRRGASAPGALTVRSGRKVFGRVVALDLATEDAVSVHPGEVHLLVGPNGSGKTTLLNAMCGLTRLDSGSVEFGGTDITRSSVARIARLGVARSYQTPRLPNELTPRELLSGALSQLASVKSPHWLLNDRTATRTRRNAHRVADELLAAAGLGHAAHQANVALTSGQRRMVDVLMALSSRATIVLLDEPAAGLSSAERLALGRTITRLASLGAGFLVVEHDLELGFSIADRVTVLATGRVIAQDEPMRIKNHDVVREVLMGTEA
jgi:ABC-type branched-subunit amino acid transport system ATPase component